jgi:hypothetical protein
LPRTVVALVEQHDAGECTRTQASPPENPFGRSQTPQSRGLRQPAIRRAAEFLKRETPRHQLLALLPC